MQSIEKILQTSVNKLKSYFNLTLYLRKETVTVVHGKKLIV